MIAWRPNRPPGSSTPATAVEVRRQELLAHRLDHLDADGGVIALVEVAVVAQLHPDAMPDPGRCGSLLSQFELFGRQRDGVHQRTPFGGLDAELTPARTDLDQAGARPDVGLVQQSVDLGPLRRTPGQRRPAPPNHAAEYVIVSSRNVANMLVREVVVLVDVVPRAVARVALGRRAAGFEPTPHDPERSRDQHVESTRERREEVTEIGAGASASTPPP